MNFEQETLSKFRISDPVSALLVYANEITLLSKSLVKALTDKDQARIEAIHELLQIYGQLIAEIKE